MLLSVEIMKIFILEGFIIDFRWVRFCRFMRERNVVLLLFIGLLEPTDCKSSRFLDWCYWKRNCQSGWDPINEVMMSLFNIKLSFKLSLFFFFITWQTETCDKTMPECWVLQLLGFCFNRWILYSKSSWYVKHLWNQHLQFSYRWRSIVFIFIGHLGFSNTEFSIEDQVLQSSTLNWKNMWLNMWENQLL